MFSVQTYDRPFINKWLREGNETCPQTKEFLEHTLVTPDETVQNMISEWYNKFCPPAPVPFGHNEVMARDHFNLLLEKIASASIPDQKAAAKEFRLLSNQVESIRAFFGESSDNITRLLSPLTLGSVSSVPDLHEDLITTVLNVSIPDGNKKLVTEHFVALPLLIESLESGTVTARTNAAAAILSLLDIESNQHLFGSAHVIIPLIHLLEDVKSGNKDVVGQAVTMLFLVPESITRAIHDGAVNLLVSKIGRHAPALYECLTILFDLCGERETFVQMYELGGIESLYYASAGSDCEYVQALCINIMYAFFFYDESYEKELIRMEMKYGSIGCLPVHGGWGVHGMANTFA